MSSKHYCLLGALQPASQSDIKAVIAIGQGHLASASRDASVNLWRRAKAGSEEADGYFQLQASFLGHSEYVNSLTHIPGESTLGTLASGGNSSLILIHNLETLSPDADECLIGHTSNVCALNYSQTQQRLVSGSWDCTARVWAQSTSGWACELSLEGHEQAVWDVQVFEQGSRVGCYLTGSADSCIYLWSSTGELLERFKGCPEPVRSLAMLPDPEEFASASNDGVIRVWDTNGSVLAKLDDHSNYIYDLQWGQSNQLLSCGEDKILRVWDSQGSLRATVLHPCTCIWSVADFEDDLIVTAGSDGVLRVWGPGPPPDTDQVPVPQDVVPEAVANDTERSPETEGRSRLVINIDYADDQPPAECVHDLNADPRSTAEAFVLDHGLTESYVERITEFIQQHLSG